MFIILGYQRSGTHMLGSLLDSHPDLKCYDEVYIRKNNSPLDTKRLTILNQNEGAIVMYSHFLRMSKYHKKIVINAKVIHLTRENLKDHAKSLVKKDNKGKKSRHATSVEKVKRWVENSKKKVMKYPFKNIFEISYEQICGGKHISEYENKDLCKFLEVKSVKMITNIKKGEW